MQQALDIPTFVSRLSSEHFVRLCQWYVVNMNVGKDSSEVQKRGSSFEGLQGTLQHEKNLLTRAVNVARSSAAASSSCHHDGMFYRCYLLVC